MEHTRDLARLGSLPWKVSGPRKLIGQREATARETSAGRLPKGSVGEASPEIH